MPISARELSDDDERRDVIPDRGVMRLPLTMMDGTAHPIPGADDQRFDVSDAQAQRDAQRLQRVFDAYQGMKERVSRGMHRHQITEPGDARAVNDSGEFNASAAAYHSAKKRLGGRWKARKQPRLVDPPWQRL